MKYVKLLGHYYMDGYFGNCSDDKRPIVEDITLGKPGTIRIHSDQDDTLYVYHDALANAPEYIKKIFEDPSYTNGAVIYKALDDLDLECPDESEIIIIPQTNWKLNGPEIYYDIYWPYDSDKGYVFKHGKIYDSKEIPIFNNRMPHFVFNDEVESLRYTTTNNVISPLFWPSGSPISDIDDRLTRLENQNQTQRKENKFMNLNNLFGDIRVGKAGRDYAITYYGTVSYRGKTYYQGQIYAVEGLTLPLDYLFFVPSNTVVAGDVISKNDTAYYITKVNTNGVEAVNLETGTVENLLAGGPFGMTMYSKLFNPMSNMVNGNIGNLLLMQSLMGDSKGGDNSLLMAMMFMGNNGFNFQLPNFTIPQAPAQVVSEVTEN